MNDPPLTTDPLADRLRRGSRLNFSRSERVFHPSRRPPTLLVSGESPGDLAGSSSSSDSAYRKERDVLPSADASAPLAASRTTRRATDRGSSRSPPKMPLAMSCSSGLWSVLYATLPRRPLEEALAVFHELPLGGSPGFPICLFLFLLQLSFDGLLLLAIQAHLFLSFPEDALRGESSGVAPPTVEVFDL